MLLEQTVSQSIHILDKGEFLGRFLGPEYTGKDEWIYDPSGLYLSSYQLQEIKNLLDKLYNK